MSGPDDIAAFIRARLDARHEITLADVVDALILTEHLDDPTNPGHCIRCGLVGPDGGGVLYRYQLEWPCRTARALASKHSDHPDYREEWAP